MFVLWLAKRPKFHKKSFCLNGSSNNGPCIACIV